MSPDYATSLLEDYRTRIEYMLDAGDSFGQIEHLIRVSEVSEEQRAELWQFAWKAWSERLRELKAGRGRAGSRWRFRAGGAAR
jgi:hypothetical protein